MNDIIMPAAFLPKTDIKANVYYVSFPEMWKKELFEIEQLKRGKSLDYNLPTTSLEKLLISWLPGVVACNAISKMKDSMKWLVSCEPVNLELLLDLVKVWIYGEYQENKKINPAARERANELSQLINVNDLFCNGPSELALFNEDGTAASSDTFRVLTLNIIERLAGMELDLGDKSVKLLYAGKNSLITDPFALFDEKSREHYSICFDFSIQTIPPSRKAMLIYHLSVKRWVSKPAKFWDYRGEDVTAYIVTGKNKIQPLKCRVDLGLKEMAWDRKDSKCYSFYKLENELPNLNEVIKSPIDYILQSPGSVVLTYRYALEMKKHIVRPGLPMVDRIGIHEWLAKSLSDLVIAKPIAERINKQLTKLKDRDINKLDKELFRRRIAQATGNNKLRIEVYSHDQEKIGEKAISAIKEHFGMSSVVLSSQELHVEVISKPLGNLSNPLDSSLSELQRFERRVNEVKEKLGDAELKPTASIVILPYKKQNGETYYEKDTDPKKALRAGFAITGRLTQFLTPDDESETEQSEDHRIEAAIYDLYRQLGYLQVPEVSSRKNKVGYEIPAMAIWIVNYKKTAYGNTQRFPLFVTTDFDKGEVRVDCEYLLNNRMRYWEACIEFQKVAANNEIRYLQKKDAATTIRRKMIELYHTQKDELLILVNSNGVSRPIWKMISDSELSKIEHKSRFSLEKLWFESAESNDGLNINERENGLRFIRIRENDEVPDYVSYVKDDGGVKSVSGVFNYDDVYWSIATRPNDPLFKSAYGMRSKIEKPSAEYKLPDMIEIYPMHLKPEDNPEEWIWYTHKLRDAAHQYKGVLRMPLPLHLAMKLEEYIG